MDILVNGARYTSWEQVPPEVRQQLAATLPDADRNGIPDLFEGNLTGLPTGTSTSTSISVNGQQVASMAALPPEVQALMRQAFGWPATPGAPAPGAAPATLHRRSQCCSLGPGDAERRADHHGGRGLR